MYNLCPTHLVCFTPMKIAQKLLGFMCQLKSVWINSFVKNNIWISIREIWHIYGTDIYECVEFGEAWLN